MPNECLNHITITCENPSAMEELNNLVINELQHKEKDTYVYHKMVEMKKRGRRGIIFDLWSPWGPDYSWLEGLLKNYPSCWVKNEWHEEGGFAGVWVGYINNKNKMVINNLTWKDISIEGRVFLFMDENEEKEYEEQRNKMTDVL